MNAKHTPVIARMRLPDGREFNYHSDVVAKYADGQVSWWTEGNAACDCNRSLFLNDEHGLNLGEPEDDDDDHCLPCGDTITLVSLTVGGVVVWRED